MTQDDTKGHKTICIDRARFAGQVPRDTDTGEHIFDENDVLKYLIDQLNGAGVGIAMIIDGHDPAIEYGGRRDYYSMPIASLDNPGVAVMDGMTELSAMLNDHDMINSWVSYQDGKSYLHIVDVEPTPEGEPEGTEPEGEVSA